MLSSLRTGDVILFAGDTPIHRFVERHVSSRWVQTGMVIVLPDINETLLFESSSRPVGEDVDTGTCRPGVRTTRLTFRVAHAEGAVAARSLIPPLSDVHKERLLAFRRSVLGRPFDFSLHSNRRSLRRCHTSFDGKAFICSSLVAAAYQYVGVMERPPAGPYPNNVLPSDFADGPSALGPDCRLGDLEMLRDV